MAEPPISQQLCKIAAVNKLPRSIGFIPIKQYAVSEI